MKVSNQHMDMKRHA